MQDFTCLSDWPGEWSGCSWTGKREHGYLSSVDRIRSDINTASTDGDESFILLF